MYARSVYSRITWDIRWCQPNLSYSVRSLVRSFLTSSATLKSLSRQLLHTWRLWFLSRSRATLKQKGLHQLSSKRFKSWYRVCCLRTSSRLGGYQRLRASVSTRSKNSSSSWACCSTRSSTTNTQPPVSNMNRRVACKTRSQHNSRLLSIRMSRTCNLSRDILSSQRMSKVSLRI